jgi:16S rRNA (uracil1498-N3)-methyltransferase
MADRFHVSSFLAPGPVKLDGPEAHHLATVCRFRPGDEVCLFNGDGHEYPARILRAGKREIEMEVLRVDSPAREVPGVLEVAAALPKGDRADFLIEKLTELGVTSFIPLKTAYSVVTPREGKLDRMERHVIEASKQCGRNRLMTIAPLTAWNDYITRPDLPRLRMLAHPGGEPLPVSTSPVDVAVAIGPEGGFREDEVTQARESGWRTVSLGLRILRIETAAIALASWFSLLHTPPASLPRERGEEGHD